MWRRREVAKKDALFASGKLLLPSPCTPSPVEKRESIKNSPFPPVARDIRVYCSESVRTASASASERLEEML